MPKYTRITCLATFLITRRVCAGRKTLDRAYCPYCENTLLDRRGFAPLSKPRKLDEMTNERKHLTGREVEKLLEATKGSFPDSWAPSKTLLFFYLKRILVDPRRKYGSWARFGQGFLKFFTASHMDRSTQDASGYVSKVVQPKLPHLIDPTLFSQFLFSHFHISSLGNLQTQSKSPGEICSEILR